MFDRFVTRLRSLLSNRLMSLAFDTDTIMCALPQQCASKEIEMEHMPLIEPISDSYENQDALRAQELVVRAGAMSLFDLKGAVCNMEGATTANQHLIFKFPSLSAAWNVPKNLHSSEVAMRAGDPLPAAELAWVRSVFGRI